MVEVEEEEVVETKIKEEMVVAVAMAVVKI